ncbi:MAG: restriction endonuclease, partial [Bacteroidota bacterium]|nr:restriction endonuclease [Bacteroidota bacterium]
MKKNNLIQVFEHQVIKYGEGNFQKSHFDSLVKFNELHSNKYFTIVHRGIKFGSYVGVIQIGNLTIEILPKIDTCKNLTSQEEKNLWRNVLLRMLKITNRIPDSISEAHLEKLNNSILELYFEIYLSEIECIINRGLIKRYRSHQSNQTALRGKILFSKNISKNLVHKEKFFCEHQIYDKNHLIHQILYKGLLIVKNLCNGVLRDKNY